MGIRHYPGNDRSTLDQIQWVKFKNNGATTAPAGAILRITGFNVSDPEEGYFEVGRPNTYGSQYSHALNGIHDVSAGKFGQCCLGQLAPALYDTADGTPAAGEMWGPRDATWKLKKNTGGFMVVGLISSTDGLVLVTPMPFLRFHGVTDAAIAKDVSGIVSIFYGPDAGTDSTVNMSSVYNSYGDVAITKDVECLWDFDLAGVKWRIIAAEC